MSLEYPHFLINYKIYDGTAGDDGLALAETIEAVQAKTGGRFVVAPQTPDLDRIASVTSLSVVAQSLDAVQPGRGNGSISLQAVAAAGADGVILNHPESRHTFSDVAAFVDACRDENLDSIVCVDSLEMGEAALAFEPDCLLFEEPADIATDQSMARTHPERIEEFVSMVADERSDTRVLLGGGISSAEDVEQALALGADAAGAASAFIDADDRRGWLTDVGEVLAAAGVE